MLAQLWNDGFEFDGVRFTWGALVEDVAAAAGLATKVRLDLRRDEVHGFPTVHVSVAAPALGRPVTWMLIALSEASRLHEDEGLAAVRARLDEDLGPGDHEWVQKRPERARSRWTLGGVTVDLTAFPSPFSFSWGRSPGRLEVHGDRQRLAEPFLPAFRASVPRPQDFTVVPAPGLRPMPGDEVALALGRPDLRAAPAWVRLGPEQIAVWAGGLATEQAALPLPAPLTHRRVRPFRGLGWAELGSDLLVCMPGPDGLDAAVARLRELGVVVATEEDEDYG